MFRGPYDVIIWGSLNLRFMETRLVQILNGRNVNGLVFRWTCGRFGHVTVPFEYWSSIQIVKYKHDCHFATTTWPAFRSSYYQPVIDMNLVFRYPVFGYLLCSRFLNQVKKNLPLQNLQSKSLVSSKSSLTFGGTFPVLGSTVPGQSNQIKDIICYCKLNNTYSHM